MLHCIDDRTHEPLVERVPEGVHVVGDRLLLQGRISRRPLPHGLLDDLVVIVDLGADALVDGVDDRGHSAATAQPSRSPARRLRHQ